MDSDRRVTKWLGVAAGGVVAMTIACGGAGAGRQDGITGSAAGEGEQAAYAAVITALDGANVAICPAPDGTPYLALPRPSSPAAREVAFFQYLDGRIYEFGPCQMQPGERNELRIFHYPEQAARDAAVLAVNARGTRPTSIFVIDDTFTAEIWSPEPGLDSPIGQVAAQVHSALGRLADTRHPDLPAG